MTPTIELLQQEIAALKYANDALGKGAFDALREKDTLKQHHAEMVSYLNKMGDEVAALYEKLIASRADMPSHDPRLQSHDEIIGSLAAILGVTVEAPPIAAKLVPPTEEPIYAHTD